MFACLLACLFACLFACLLVCLLVCLLTCSFVCLFVCSSASTVERTVPRFRVFVCLFVCSLVFVCSLACLCAQVPRRLRGRPHASFRLFAAPPAARRAARRYVCAAWGCAGERAIRSSEATGYASQPRKEVPLPVTNPVHACMRQTCDRQRAGVRACVRHLAPLRRQATVRRCMGYSRDARGVLEGCSRHAARLSVHA